MSLDVSLYSLAETVTSDCECCGQSWTREVSDQVFSANITHNLNTMADEAGIYYHLWEPDKIGISVAAQLIEPIRSALILMKSDPDRFCAHNAKNGWGTYDQFVPWLEKYLEALIENPNCLIEVSR